MNGFDVPEALRALDPIYPMDLPAHPADLLAPTGVPPPPPTASVPLARPPHLDLAPASRAAVGVVTFDLASQILEARDKLDKELSRASKEYQVLRSIAESELPVCQDLVIELKQRLAGHALYEAILQLDAAYSTTLRYRRT
ncbi:MAG TPA: hypothetical protein PK264_08970 [Hyphomicrobiaceae bacterium]|nr:hypothetical protein [Hyphomicrobiaceae bacterium]